MLRGTVTNYHPHEAVLLATSVLLGTNYLLVTVPPPSSLQALVPKWVVVTWSLGLLISGVVGLVAIFWKHSVVRALEAERGALYMSSGALLLILGASLAINGLRSIFSIGIIAAWMVANVVRARQIRRELQAIERVIDSA